MSNVDQIIAGIGHEAHNRVTFDAANGKIGTFTLFEVTGTVAVRIVATCEVNLAGSGTLAIGTVITPTGLITTTTATDIDAGDIWHDATPDASVELSSVSAEKIVNQSVIATVATNTITSGRIKFTVLWKPISEDGYLVSTNLGGSASPSASPSASLSPSTSVSPSASTSISPSASRSPSASVSPSTSASASYSPSASRSPSASVSPSASASRSMDI